MQYSRHRMRKLPNFLISKILKEGLMQVSKLLDNFFFNFFILYHLDFLAMMSKLDESVGRVVSALNRRGMLENSILVFMSDNGAPTHGIHYNRGSNYPLRGVSLILDVYSHQ